MAVRGWVQACEWQPRGSELVADAADDAIFIEVEDLTDFDDAGGILSLNDQTISYDDDAIDEDAGTILLNTGLADAATIGDPVYTVSGGQVMTDVVLFVSCGDGDNVEVRAPFAQRDYWPEGDYDPPVMVELSDDLERVLEAPGRIPTSTELAETRGGYDGTLQDIYDSADAAAAAAADAAANATTALIAANGKNKVWVSLSSPGTTPNAAGDVWFRKESATQTIIEQWEGQGGTSWNQVTLNNQVIANLDAGKLVAGSAFINGLSVKTNFTLGDASTNGVIQSHNFAGSSVGVYIDKFGLVAKGGSIAGATITGGTAQVVSLGTLPSSGGGGVVAFERIIRLFDSGGSIMGSWDGDTGEMQLYGDLDMNGASIGGAFAVAAVGVSAFNVSGTDVYVTGTPTEPGVGLGAVYMGATGRLRLSSSAERTKTDIEELVFDHDLFLEVPGVTYLPAFGEDQDPTVGMIADRFDERGFTHLVGYRDEEVATLHYERVSAYHQQILRSHHERIAELEQQRAEDRALIERLITRIEQLEAP